MSVFRFSLPAGFWRRSLPVLAIAAAMGAAFFFRLDNVFSFEMLASSRMALHDFVAAHGVNALAVFVAAYTILVALSVPGASVMTLAGGFAFGTLVGGTAAAIGSTLGASALYFVASSSLAPLLSERADGIVTRLRKGFAADASSYMLFLRLSPVFPFWLVNLGSALAGIPFRTFLWTTAVGILPATFTFAFAGASLDNLVALAQTTQAACRTLGMGNCPLQLPLSAILTPRMVALLVSLSLIALLPVGMKKLRAARRKRIVDFPTR